MEYGRELLLEGLGLAALFSSFGVFTTSTQRTSLELSKEPQKTKTQRLINISNKQSLKSTSTQLKAKTLITPDSCTTKQCTCMVNTTPC